VKSTAAFGYSSAPARQYLRPLIAGSNVRIEAGPPIYRAHGRFKCFMGLKLALIGKSARIGMQSTTGEGALGSKPG
jgi:hypothetical protein